MMYIAPEFGLTPASWSRISVPAERKLPLFTLAMQSEQR
jgi:hypothetical protein